MRGRNLAKFDKNKNVNGSNTIFTLIAKKIMFNKKQPNEIYSIHFVA